MRGGELERRRGTPQQPGDVRLKLAIVVPLISEVKGGDSNLPDRILDAQGYLVQLGQLASEPPARGIDLLDRRGNDRQRQGALDLNRVIGGDCQRPIVAIQARATSPRA